MKLLIISDTHGEMPVDIKKIEFDAVIHAGDIGDAAFFGKLDSETGGRNLYAVYGNTDFVLSGYLPETVSTEIGGLKFFIVHNLTAPHRIMPANEKIIAEKHAEIVVSGHTHVPAVEERDGIVFGSTNDGVSFALDGHTGRLLWRHKTGNSLMNTLIPLGKRRLLFSNTEGNVGMLEYR